MFVSGCPLANDAPLIISRNYRTLSFAKAHIDCHRWMTAGNVMRGRIGGMLNAEQAFHVEHSSVEDSQPHKP